MTLCIDHRHRWLLALLACLVLCAPAARPSREATPGDVAFGGGGGTVNPVPPIGLLPVPPTLGHNGGYSRFLLQVQAPTARVAVLRTRDGKVIDVVHLDASVVRLAMAVPLEGALLDVLGTDALGVPVVPGITLTVVGG